MNDARNIGEEFACTSSQSLISAFRCGLANEFRNRFAPYGGGTLNLFVEVGIQAEASHGYSVSHMINSVIQPFQLGTDSPPSRSTLAASPATPAPRELARYGVSRRHRFGVSIVGDRDGNGRSKGGVRVKCSWPVTGCGAVAVCAEAGRCTTGEGDELSYRMATTSPPIRMTMASVATRIRSRRRRVRGTLRRPPVDSLR